MKKSKVECENISFKYDESRRWSNSISVLVVDDDTTCLSFVAALLKKLKYEVVTAKHPNDALCALRIKGEAFDLVVSDVHMPDMNGFELQEAIAHEFNLPVVLMSVDSEEVVVSKGMKSGAALFISKPVSPNDLKNLWQFASMRKKTRKPAASPSTKEGEVNAKKPKVIWTNALHYRFLEAIRSIGLERSVPKKILEAMNVPGLTRENVASHLQKYRIFLKRVSDASYKLDCDCGDDEGLISSRSSIWNYSSSTTTNSLLMLNRLQEFVDLPPPNPAPFPSMHQSHHQLISIPAVVHTDASSILGLNTSSQVGTQTQTQIISAFDHTNNIKHLSPAPAALDFCDRNDQLQNNILGLDQYLSDLPLIQDLDEPAALYNHLPAFDIMATQQPLRPTHLHNHPCDQMNTAQQNQINECDYTASSLFYGGMNNSSYDQALHLQGEDEDVLESLLAFGEDQMQTLEGI